MRKALIIGIDFYEHVNNLHGCVNDAYCVKAAIDRNSDGTINFSSKICVASNEDSRIDRKELKHLTEELFEDDSDIALFYFSGHGYVENTGGYLITSDCKDGDDGFSLTDLLIIANESKAKNKIIILDCCHAGFMGKIKGQEGSSILSEGLTILTASSETQYALETNGSGVFTSLLVDALNGSASNLVGEITPGSIYAHIDQSLGPWEQRPIFKTNVKSFVSLRKVQPPIQLSDLKELVTLFNERDDIFKLDPSFEPTSDNPNEENNEQFAILQKLNRVNLVVPVDEEHMYFAAMNSTGCQLTILGEHYWNLIKKERI
ncbi:MAG: Uncharacterised protein [Bacteroidetes bacterium MED-G17]|nr:MAG: Uncharacterised protein [Bacteroidetes bacterium MED-G17]